jgi:hypothetical protein
MAAWLSGFLVDKCCSFDWRGAGELARASRCASRGAFWDSPATKDCGEFRDMPHAQTGKCPAFNNVI